VVIFRISRVKRFLVTMGGVGYLPASGTFASLLTCLLLWPLLAWATPMGQLAVAVIGTILFSVLNVVLAPWAIKEFNDEDPGKFVLDEAAGICLTILLLPPRTGWETGITLLVAFVAFRIFDITKIPPCRQLEHLPEGWGILMDDLAAAVYANIVCQIVLRWAVSA
jgi:phosphatidylglycerophosphatase A